MRAERSPLPAPARPAVRVPEAAAADRAPARIAPLDRGLAQDAARLAAEVFRESRFYQDAMGFDADAFDEYWDLFLPLAMSDPRARVLGAEADGRLAGLLILAYHGFPSLRRAVSFACRLVSRVGPVRFARYLLFVRRYERAMRRSRSEQGAEARGSWLLVSRSAGRSGLGARLVREGIALGARDGRPLATGLLDASDERLARFYRRAGFFVGEPFPMGRGRAATMELRPRGSAPC